ncbi:uncharacterized protein A4U43_C04F6660 [Asparagus officinalis]|uniref:EamA domain-containing protein n=1 Tax=Asparagus officinalis TaxID=4686 RepID=A0A5P1EYT8_ASPOF|nr:uncharacterized protein A4U43_C04F6660 [Asparagus officinalis]
MAEDLELAGDEDELQILSNNISNHKISLDIELDSANPVPWYWYIILAIIDVQANYLFVKAYQYSSITSITLLDCWTIPWVIILTWFILKTHYSLWQFFGAAICVIGLALVLLSDSRASQGGGRNPLSGDTLVIMGTFCYALSNVGEEYCVKKKDRVEVVAMLGIFGVLVTACEISIFERKDLASVQWSTTIVALFAGFAAASFLFYALVPFLLKLSGSTLFNLSLLTSDMWAVLIRLYFYKQQVNWLYFVAFAIVTAGLIIYSLNDTTDSSTSIAGTAETWDEEAKLLTEENSLHEEVVTS